MCLLSTGHLLLRMGPPWKPSLSVWVTVPSRQETWCLCVGISMLRCPCAMIGPWGWMAILCLMSHAAGPHLAWPMLLGGPLLNGVCQATWSCSLGAWAMPGPRGRRSLALLGGLPGLTTAWCPPAPSHGFKLTLCCTLWRAVTTSPPTRVCCFQGQVLGLAVGLVGVALVGTPQLGLPLLGRGLVRAPLSSLA